MKRTDRAHWTEEIPPWGGARIGDPAVRSARVRATPAAARAVAAMHAEAGPVVFTELLDRDELLCFGRDDLSLSKNDVLLGTVDECPIYLDQRARRPKADVFVLDATDHPDGPRFHLWPRACGRPATIGWFG